MNRLEVALERSVRALNDSPFGSMHDLESLRAMALIVLEASDWHKVERVAAERGFEGLAQLAEEMRSRDHEEVEFTCDSCGKTSKRHRRLLELLYTTSRKHLCSSCIISTT